MTIKGGSIDGYDKKLVINIPTLEPTSDLPADALPLELSRARALVKPGADAAQAPSAPAKDKPQKSKAARFSMR